jgi:hypothetical protein
VTLLVRTRLIRPDPGVSSQPHEDSNLLSGKSAAEPMKDIDGIPSWSSSDGFND